MEPLRDLLLLLGDLPGKGHDTAMIAPTIQHVGLMNRQD
jgi:hypothetical protein